MTVALRRRRPHIRIVSGAPFAYKTTNISVLGLFAGNGRLEDILAADDPDRLVVDLDRIDDRVDVAFAGVGVARIELRVHQLGEGVDLLRIDGGCHAALGAGMIEGGLGSVALGFQSGGALSQDIVELDDAVVNRAISRFMRSSQSVNSFCRASNRPSAASLFAAWRSISDFRSSAIRSGASTRCLMLVKMISSRVAAGMWRPLHTDLPFCWQLAHE